MHSRSIYVEFFNKIFFSFLYSITSTIFSRCAALGAGNAGAAAGQRGGASRRAGAERRRASSIRNWIGRRLHLGQSTYRAGSLPRSPWLGRDSVADHTHQATKPNRIKVTDELQIIGIRHLGSFGTI